MICLQGAGILGFVGLAIAFHWQGGQILQAFLLILFILSADQVQHTLQKFAFKS